jgi:hypothetical protein
MNSHRIHKVISYLRWHYILLNKHKIMLSEFLMGQVSCTHTKGKHDFNEQRKTIVTLKLIHGEDNFTQYIFILY